MTLAQVRDKLTSWLGGSEACLDAPKVAELSAMISAIDDSLAQPAQRAQKAVDVQAVMRDAAVWMPSAVESQRVREASAVVSGLIDALRQIKQAAASGIRYHATGPGYTEEIVRIANAALANIDQQS